MADTLTVLRMVGIPFLLFFPPLSFRFLVVYALAGLTDVLDGWVARKTGTVSDFGARLDSIADLLFYGCLLLRLFPILHRDLPGEIWYAVAAILFVRLCAYGTAAVKYHRFASLHTWLNKLTGFTVFLLPFVLLTPVALPYSWGLCTLAFAASMEELAIHLGQAHYSPDRKSLFHMQNTRGKKS